MMTEAPRPHIEKSTRLILALIIGVAFLLSISVNWVGYLGSDDGTYVKGAYGWIESFPFVGGHGTIRYTITLPMALAFVTLGEREVSMVLPTLLYGLWMVVMLALLVSRRLGTKASLAVGFGLITSPLLVIWSTIASVDVIEACFVMASLFCFLKASEEESNTRWLLASGAAAGLGFLTRETTVFFLLSYAVMFLAGYGIKRWQYFVMAAGFVAIWLLEVGYLYIMTGDPLYRVTSSLNHDSTIDRSIDLAGNVILHPLIDPFFVILINQEFVFLFWLAVPLALYVFRSPVVSRSYKKLATLFSLVGLCWFVSAGMAQTLLPLNPRYFLLVAIAGLVVSGLGISALAENGRPRLAFLCATLLIGGNVLGLTVENKNLLFGERVLVATAQKLQEPLYTDPITHYRARILIRFAGVEDKIIPAPPPNGGLYLFNPHHAGKPNRLKIPYPVKNFLPQPFWQTENTLAPNPKLVFPVLDTLGIPPYLPDRVQHLLKGGHDPVQLYRATPPEDPQSQQP